MAVQAYTLVQPWDGKEAGAVLVQTTASCPFDLAIFRDADDADAFAEWASGDLKWGDMRNLRKLRNRWEEIRDWAACECGSAYGVEPGHEVCIDCECDREFVAKRAREAVSP